MSDPASLPLGFRDVDAAAPAQILRCLECIPTLAGGRAYKARALELLALGPGGAALDVACGLGDDVARMKAGCARAVGVDRSRTLVAAARERHAGSGCEFKTGDATALPFTADTFLSPAIPSASSSFPRHKLTRPR